MIISELVGRPLLVDSMLSVLLCVGLAGTRFIKNHKRLRSYDETDFRILQHVLKNSSQRIVSPNILTEMSNLARQSSGHIRDYVTQVCQALIDESREIYLESAKAASDTDFMRLGLTDASILKILEENRSFILITSDHALHLTAAYRELSVVNFNHIRDQRTDFR